MIISHVYDEKEGRKQLLSLIKNAGYVFNAKHPHSNKQMSNRIKACFSL